MGGRDESDLVVWGGWMEWEETGEKKESGGERRGQGRDI
jgi:hypothetical protein